MGYAICTGIIAGLSALAAVYYKAFKDPNEPGAAGFVGSIAGFFVSIVMWLGIAYFFPTTDNGGGGLSFSAVLGICVVGGALAGGLSSIIWAKKYNILGILPIGQGIFGGGIGAVIGLAILIVFLLAMMGG